ncbi:MAG: RNA polymerase factor sigma-54 [Hungatella sp.]|nr:RNA polymerase factor sigma-54 [Hungatella sp.]
MKLSQQIHSKAQQNTRQTTKQKVTTAMIQGVKILALPVQEMEHYLEEAVYANPLLEVDYQREAVHAMEEEELPEDSYDSNSEFSYDKWLHRKKDLGILDPEGLWNLKGTPFELDCLEGVLKLQLASLKLPEAEHRIGLDILGNIDGRGYFVGNLASICYAMEAPLEMGEKILSLIQTFLPKGIGARNLAECLSIQVDKDFPHEKIAGKMIRESLGDLAERRFAKLARQYGVKRNAVEEIYENLAALNPKPANGYGTRDAVGYIIPDITVCREKGGFGVVINGEAENMLRINEEYLSMLDDDGLNAEAAAYIRAKYQEARLLINSIQIRSQSLYQFAWALLEKQNLFFKMGPEYLKPLTMQEMADSMGVHVSTVSRLVQDKYADTPYGCFPLKYFFNVGIVCGEEDVVSSSMIKRRISRMIREEDVHKPLSDAQICQILNEEGYPISRRTVAKYRQMQNIDSQAKRRR